MLNEHLKNIYDWRATILSQSENLVAHFSKINSSQMSLFPISEDESFEMGKPKDIDYEKIAEQEFKVLGICLSYNPFDQFILQRLRFCNSNISDIANIIEDNDNIIFIAKVDEIEYLTSKYGNFYAKITFKDAESSVQIYLFGDMYKRYIGSIYKNKYYLIKSSYDAKTQRISVLSIKNICDIEMSEYISEIKLHLGLDIRNIILVKEYVGIKMFGNSFDLVFIYEGIEYKHPLKINFTTENYLDIKDYIESISITIK